MLDFVWRYKYILFVLIFLIFINSLFSILNPKIFFETERILMYADDIQIELEESFNDKNLLLLGLEFDEKISLDKMSSIKSSYENIKNDSLIKLERSVFNQKKMLFSGLFFHSFDILNLSSEEKYQQSIEKLNEKSAMFLSKDLKKIFFILEMQDDLESSVQEKLINKLRTNFNKNNPKQVFVSGQIPSELYMQENVVKELFYITFLSAFFCCLILWVFTMNIKFVLLTLISVIFSIVISISVSQFLYGGIELVMIIMPAIIFIVCVSDLMHLINDANIKFDNKKDFFKQKVKKIGVPVALTSLTTAIGFLSFCFSDVLPITRFGLITTIGIIISLFIILVSYSICVDLNFHKLKGNLKINKLIDTFIYNITHIQSKLKYYSIIFIMILIAVYGIQKVEVDNYLTDEVNKKSSLYKEMSFFNDNFGGIKPVTFKTSVDNKTEINQLLDFENFLIQKEFSLDFSLTRMVDNPELVSKSVLKKITKDSYKMQTRMNDQGSKKSFQIFEQIKDKADLLSLPVKIGGAGYLFDQVSNKLTLEIIYGLIIAVLTIGILFIIINKFNFRYFFVALIPNVFPIVVTIGILCFSNFYFSLSNAFIFAIVFGLIVDDSIHILSSYRSNIRNGFQKEEAIQKALKITARAVLKTTIIVIITLLPLLISEFKSVSQLSVITIISAVIAIIFDLIYLPNLIRRYL